ncbi:MAG: methyltransferase [Chitinophagaceae bacterium]|nr:methyltransferase [Chitinophagaceae bacterium]
MPNPYFQFKQFTVYHDRCAMKVTTDACMFGAWVAQNLAQQENGDKSFLDIGTGTGLLSLMIAQQTQARIDAIEIDPQAAAQATENIKASPWSDRINVITEDLHHFHPEKKYDQIISNPPFYEKEIPSASPGKQAAHHGEGLLLEELFDWVKNNMKQEGRFHALLPFKRKQAIHTMLRKAGLFVEEWVEIKPTGKALPLRILLRASLEKPLVVYESEEIIAIEGNDYSAFFRGLVKDYYL